MATFWLFLVSGENRPYLPFRGHRGREKVRVSMEVGLVAPRWFNDLADSEGGSREPERFLNANRKFWLLLFAKVHLESRFQSPKFKNYLGEVPHTLHSWLRLFGHR